MSIRILDHASISKCFAVAVYLRNYISCHLLWNLLGELIAWLIKASRNSKSVTRCHLLVGVGDSVILRLCQSIVNVPLPVLASYVIEMLQNAKESICHMSVL
jgi:hypothetical protein